MVLNVTMQTPPKKAYQAPAVTSVQVKAPNLLMITCPDGQAECPALGPGCFDIAICP